MGNQTTFSCFISRPDFQLAKGLSVRIGGTNSQSSPDLFFALHVRDKPFSHDRYVVRIVWIGPIANRTGHPGSPQGEKDDADIPCNLRAAGQAMLPLSRSLRRRKPSRVASRMTDTVVRITAAAVMVGLMFSRMPLNISRGRVRCFAPAMNSTITTSSKLVAKANSAPDATPGRISGRITRRNA